jgi:hypothetical protein
MLSNRIKDGLVNKFNLHVDNIVAHKNVMHKNAVSKKVVNSDESSSDESSSDESSSDESSSDESSSDESSSDESSSDESSSDESSSDATTVIVNTYYIDTLTQTIPNKDYENIRICMYKINTNELYPFIMFLLHKNISNVLSFPKIEYKGQELINHVLRKFKLVFDGELIFKGYIEENKDIILIINYIGAERNRIGKKTYDTEWWWALTSEIINSKCILNFEISKSTTQFLIKHSKLCFLHDIEDKIYESPECGYYGNHFKKIITISSIGLSRETPYASFGPYYYFSNYTHAIRNAIWSNNFKPVKVDNTYITIDDRGRYEKGGIIRFALFSGKTKMLIGRQHDKIDDSSISKELADKKEFVKEMLKLRDTSGKWVNDYDSIRIGSHDIKIANQDTIHTSPMVALKKFEQHVQLEYYFVDTLQTIDGNNTGKAVIM